MLVLLSTLSLIPLAHCGASTEARFASVTASHISCDSADADKLQPKPEKEPSLKRYRLYVGVIGCGALTFMLDKDLNILSQKQCLHGSTADRFFGFVEHFGKGRPYFVAVPLLAGHGILFHNKKSVLVSGELALEYLKRLSSSCRLLKHTG